MMLPYTPQENYATVMPITQWPVPLDARVAREENIGICTLAAQKPCCTSESTTELSKVSSVTLW